MEKKAKLVAISLMTRVIVRSDATDEQVWSAAVPRLINAIRDGGMDNIEFTEEDVECPYSQADENEYPPAPKTLTQPPTNSRLLGYRIESADGTHQIPPDLYSFFILSEKAADYWLELDRLNPSGEWKKVRVYNGEIDDPVIINTISHKDDRE